LTYTAASNANGSATVTVRAHDDGGTANGGQDTSGPQTFTITITPVNDAPVVKAGADRTGNENDMVSVSATFTDVEAADAHTCQIDWGDGSSPTAGAVTEPSGAATPGTCTGSHVYLDDNPTGTASDVYTVNITVTDNGKTNGNPDPKSDMKTLKATISNVNPVITSTTGPTGPQALGPATSVTTNFTDVGSKDTHTCTYTWDDGSPATTVNAPGMGNGSCTATHTYTGAGVYAVHVKVLDDDTGSVEADFAQYVVIYDPNAGFVTGGGFINSPAGAYRADQTLAGKANFGFNAQYKKGANVPTGETEFQFQVGNLNFHSATYQWLVVSGTSKAQYKGTGTINGSGNYGFLLTAYDGSPDKFRIKIWDNNNGGAIVYDNNYSSPDDIDTAAPLAIAGGSIVIHK
jgi:hypothetical protein